MTQPLRMTLSARNIVLLLVIALSASSAFSQDDDDIQSWNDVNFTIKVSKRIDLVIPTTLRFAENISKFNEAWIGAGVVLKPTSRFSITPYYLFIKTRNSAGLVRPENRYHLRAVYRFPTKGFGLSHRSQLEYRDRTTSNTWRYRPSVTLEKRLPNSFMKDARVFATEEPFYDSASGRFSRNRFSVGAGRSFNKSLGLDIYYLRQDDNFSGPALVHVIGTTLKVNL